MQVFSIKLQFRGQPGKPTPPEAFLGSQWGETGQDAMRAFLDHYGIEWATQWGDDGCTAESPLEPNVRFLARPVTRSTEEFNDKARGGR